MTCNNQCSSTWILHSYFTASVQNKDLSLFYRNLLSRRVSGGSEREEEGKATKDRDVVRQSQQQSSSVEVAKSAGTIKQVHQTHIGSSSQERSRRRRSPSPEHGGTRRKSSSSSSTDATHRGRLHSSEVQASPEEQQHPKSPSPARLAEEETPTAVDDDAEVAANTSKPLSKEDQKLAAEIVRKRKAEQRNDEVSVSAARERYLARKKAKQTAMPKANDGH